MSRETVEAKAVRYLGEGRVLLERVDEAGVRALVGGSEVYEVGCDRGAELVCSCPATRRCAHVVAVALVTGLSSSAAAEGGDDGGG